MRVKETIRKADSIVWMLAVFAVSLGVFSCQKEDLKSTIANQDKEIERFVNSLAGMDYRIERYEGIVRAVVEEGSGEEAQDGDSLHLIYSGYIFSGGPGTLFATNDTTMVDNTTFFPASPAPERICLGRTPLIEGLAKGLKGVKKGEHCYIFFSAKYGFYNTIVYSVPKLSPLFYDIAVENVIKNR